MQRDTSNRALNVSAWIFVGAATMVALQGVVDGLPRHGVDPSWPDHARFHISYSTFSQIGFCLMTAAIALIPFRRAERWSWWVLLGFVIFGNFSLVPAALWQGSGPQSMFIIPIGVAYAALIAALAMTYKVGFPRSSN
jgi:hypothetical protein